MNKKDLVRRIAQEMSVTIDEADLFVNTFEEVLTTAIKQNDSVILLGFGKFYPWHQHERSGRTVTGEPILIEERNNVKFRPGKFLLEALNEGKENKK